jgi:hypothetical protein
MNLEKLQQKARESGMFEIKSEGEKERKAGRVFCCDLLSVAMSKIPENGVWVTVISNMNTLAVASLTEAACVILAEDTAAEENLIQKAVQEKICLMTTKLPVFEAAKLMDGWLYE